MLWRHRIRRWQFYSLIETRGPRGPGWRWSRSRISSSDDRIKPRIGDVFGDFHIFISRVQMIQERQRCWPIQISIVPGEPRSRWSRCSQGVWRRHDFRIMFQILANCFSWSFFKEGVRRSFKAVWSPAENRWKALPAERDRIRSSSTLDTFLRPIIGKFLFQLALDINFFLKACFLSFFINESIF